MAKNFGAERRSKKNARARKKKKIGERAKPLKRVAAYSTFRQPWERGRTARHVDPGARARAFSHFLSRPSPMKDDTAASPLCAVFRRDSPPILVSGRTGWRDIAPVAFFLF